MPRFYPASSTEPSGWEPSGWEITHCQRCDEPLDLDIEGGRAEYMKHFADDGAVCCSKRCMDLHNRALEEEEDES